MKKGRHRRFEEARKLKQSGPDFLFNEPTRTDHSDSDVDEDETTTTPPSPASTARSTTSPPTTTT